MNKRKIEISNDAKQILFFVLLFIIGIFGITVCFMLWGNSRQVYNDVIREYTSMLGSNKSLEIWMGYGSAILGIIAMFVFVMLRNKKNNDLSKDICIDDKNGRYFEETLWLIAFLIFLFFDFLNNKNASIFIIVPLLLIGLTYIKDKKYVVLGGSLYFVFIYAEFAIYQLYIYLGGQKDLKVTLALLIAAFVVLTLLFTNVKTRDVVTYKLILLLQSVMPFLLFAYLKNSYLYQNQIVFIQIPLQITLFIFGLFLVLAVVNLQEIKKRWSGFEANARPYVSCVTCMMLLTFNRFNGHTAFVPEDLRHPYENILTFSQIFEHGTKLYSGYYPFSGLFAVVHGAFFSVFGNGEASNYNLSSNVFYLCVSVIVAILICKHLEGTTRLLTALIFTVGSAHYFSYDYDRVSFILPIILLLTLPELIENKNKWLMLWIVTSFWHVLYYPVYGAAVSLAFAPLGIWQFISYVRSGELTKDIRRKEIWIHWALCVIPILLCLPTLLRLLLHSKVVSKQTIYEAGMSRFGQILPDDFLSIIPSDIVRRILFYSFTFLIFASVIWISFGMFFEFASIKIKNRKININISEKALIVIVNGIVFLVSISFVMVRLDAGYLYARGTGAIFAAFVVFIVIANRFLDRKKALWLCAYAFMLIAMTTEEGFDKVDYYGKLRACYSVPDDYVYIVDEEIEHLGEGFVETETGGRIKYATTNFSALDKNLNYLAVTKDFGEHYLLGLKGSASIELATVKGYDIATEMANAVVNNGSIVGSYVDSTNCYYFYYWLLNSGKYFWDKEQSLFLPNNGLYSIEEIYEKNKTVISNTDSIIDLAKTPAAWGQSIKELTPIFESKDKADYPVVVKNDRIIIQCPEESRGKDMDFLYLEFDQLANDYQLIQFGWHDEYIQESTGTVFDNLYSKWYNPDMFVVLSWQNETGDYYGISCWVDKGQLLIPLGMGSGWLMNKHSQLEIFLVKDGNMVPIPDIADIRFLKLREIEIED